jgi:hypothetical protein
VVIPRNSAERALITFVLRIPNGQNYCGSTGGNDGCLDFPGCSSDADCSYGDFCANTGLQTSPEICLSFLACLN